MKFTTNLFRKITDITGYQIFKTKHAPVGFYLDTDIRHRLRLPMHTVIDVGANTGQTALEMAHDFPQAKIHSFEPVSETFKRLQANTKHLPQVHCVHGALGEAEEKKTIRLYPQEESVINSLNDWGMSARENAPTETVTILTGDAYCATNGITQIDLLKIDTEGYEIPVIKGFDKMLKAGAIKAIYCETSFNRNDKMHTYINDLNDLVNDYGYFFYGIYGISNASIKVDRNYGNVLYINAETKENVVL